MAHNQTNNVTESDYSASAGSSTPMNPASEGGPHIVQHPNLQSEPHQQSYSAEDTIQQAVVTSQPAHQLASEAAPPQKLLATHTLGHIRRRLSRRREDTALLPELIDARIVHILNTLTLETDVERFCRSLTPHLATVPRQYQVRVRAAILMLIDASQDDRDPSQVLSVIEHWRTGQQAMQQPPAAPTLHCHHVPPGTSMNADVHRFGQHLQASSVAESQEPPAASRYGQVFPVAPNHPTHAAQIYRCISGQQSQQPPDVQYTEEPPTCNYPHLPPHQHSCLPFGAVPLSPCCSTILPQFAPHTQSNPPNPCRNNTHSTVHTAFNS
ncbi:uncharacterized protein ACNLHF_010737 [Anomaloglossus baeobatrachus]|uniref:uncharacterized protein LOC142296925 n=1 Tax=Anomaloglossus baeobatrachus TaxID=238106 RepID=UPI003F4F8018